MCGGWRKADYTYSLFATVLSIRSFTYVNISAESSTAFYFCFCFLVMVTRVKSL